MNVLILEMGGSHIECIYTFVHLLKLQGHHVHLACNKKLLHLFPEKDRLAGVLPLADDVIQSTQVPTFLTIRKYIRKHKIDTLIINTVEIKIIRNLSFFIPRKLNCTGVVHHAKKLEKSETFTKLLSRRIKKYFVLGDNLLKNINPHHLFEVNAFYPIYFPRPLAGNVVKPDNEFWVTVAGEAEQVRRDYCALINKIQQGTVDPGIRFIFLGKYNLDDVIDPALKETDWWRKHIVCFDEHVDYDTFHNYIKQSDVILPLIKLHNDERYSTSRISGSFNLGLGYKKPFLLPKQFKANSELKPYSIYYSSMDQLIESIGDLRKSTSIQGKIESAYQGGPFQNVDEMAGSVCSFISKSVDK